MPDFIQQNQQRQLDETQSNLAQAQHQADWANWFTSTPPSEVLRQNLNFTSMIDNAVEQKQRLLAQTDENAQRIYLNNKRFQAEQELQPLKVQHAQAQIDHEQALTNAVGAADIHKMNLEKQAADELTAMVKGIPTIAGIPGTTDHAVASAQYFSQFPHAITTPIGKDILDRHIATHKSVAEMQGMLPTEPLPAGQTVKIGADGIPQLTAASPLATKNQATRYFTGSDGAVYGFGSEGIVRNGKPIDVIPEGVNLGAVNRPLHIGNAMVDASGKVLFEAPKDMPATEAKNYRASLTELAKARNGYMTILNDVKENGFKKAFGHGGKFTEDQHDQALADYQGAQDAIDTFHQMYPSLGVSVPASAPQKGNVIRKYNPATGKIE